MAAPTATARQTPTPTKIRIDEGFSIKITFASQPALAVHEKMVTPSGWSAGGGIDVTSQFNLEVFTKRARRLKEQTPVTYKAAYSPDELDVIRGLIGFEDTITETFPDGTTLAYYGFLDEFTPDQFEIGKQPEATMKVVPTNWDKVNHVEAGPVLTVVSGT